MVACRPPSLPGRKLSPRRLQALLDRLWRIEEEDDWRSLFERMRIDAGERPAAKT